MPSTRRPPIAPGLRRRVPVGASVGLGEALRALLDPPPTSRFAVAGPVPSSWASVQIGGTVEQDGARPAGGDAGSRGHAASVDLETVVAEYTPAVYRLARSVVRDPGLADDVTQDTFIKVWQHLDDYRGDGSLRGWVLRIAHNTAVSTLRRVRDTATDPSTLPDAGEAISTVRVVEGRLAVGALDAALDELDELSREIVVLREVEGLTYEEIAEALDVPIPTVKTRLLRARRRLTVALEGWRP